MTGGVVVLAEGEGSSALLRVLEQARASDSSARTISAQEAVALARSRGSEDLPAVVVIGPTVAHPLQAARHLKAAGLDVDFVFAAVPESAAQLRRQLSYAAPPDSSWELEAADSPELARVIQKVVVAASTRKRLRATLDHINARISQAQPSDDDRYRQLIVSDRYLASILEHAEDGIISLDPAGTVTSWNRGAERLFGVTPAEAIGAPVASLLSAAPGIHETVREAASGNVSRRELRWDAGRAAKYLDAMFTPIESGARQVIGLAVIVRDVTELKQAEEALREADRRKDEFLAVLAHELRNPLAPIRSAVEILKAPELDDAQREWSRRVVDRQVRHMARLLDDLLDISRISRSRLNLKKERVPLQEAVDAAVEAARPLISAKEHVLEVELPEEPLMLDADPVRLAQIMVNLLTNAAKYTAASGRVRIAVTTAGDTAVIAVEDNGIGIARERLSSVFEMFAQAPAEHPEAGIGVGLALTRGLVELHGGSIEAHSDGVGQGSRFVVKLPCLLDAAPRPEGNAGSEPAQRRHAARRVLVVDDNQDAADSLAVTLELVGHQVRVAYDGRHALDEVSRFLPEIVLLDIGLPDMNGYEVARRVRAMPGGGDIRLIALTGWGQEEDKRRADEAGFDAHVTKPVDPRGLMALVSDR